MTSDPTSAYLIGAHGAAADRVVAWVGVVGAPTLDLQLVVGDSSRAIPDQWTVFSSRRGDMRGQRITVDGLAADHEYPLRLVAGGEVMATARASTLPPTLPTPPDRPLTVLLGSCFCVAQDPACLVGAAAHRLPAFVRPHVTVLAGDQVYLDSPFLHFIACTHSEDELADELLATYLATWTQRASVGGFQRLLTAANTVFTSDDHDLWNNAPIAAPYVRDTWTASGRATWRDAAIRLFRIFQASEPGQTFSVGRLSFFVADTRMGRTEDLASFMTSDQLAALDSWVRRLDGPGVLVIGQPIFVAETGWKGQFTDRGLADYRQYDDLVRTLTSTPHDLVVLTGDVHFGRVATCELPSGRRLIELIASPFSLVHSLAAGKWGPATTMFPARPVSGVVRGQVSTAAYRRTDDHFVTAGFSAAGLAVQMSVTAWPIQGGGPQGEPVVSTVLH